MKCILLVEENTGKKTAIKVIANSLPDALFTIAAEAEQANESFVYNECDICPCNPQNGVCKRPIETFSHDDEKVISAWGRSNNRESNGGKHEQRIIREFN